MALSNKEGGCIKAIDKNTHEYLFMLRLPQGLDSKQYRIDYRYELNGNTLHLVPHCPWQFEYATFPVAVDPSISTIAWDIGTDEVAEATNTPTPTPTNTPPPVFRFEGINLENLNIN